MAELNELTLPNAEAEQVAAAEMRRDQLTDRRQQMQQAAKQKSPLAALPGGTAPTAAAELAIRQGWVKGWQYVQEAVEDLALAFYGLGSIVVGPVVILIYTVRLVVGVFLNGGTQIGRQGITVPLVPGYGFVEGFYRTLKFVLIAAITGLLYSILLVTAFAVTHPADVVGTVWAAVWKFITDFFGGG